MAMAAAKAISDRRLRSPWFKLGRGVAAGAQAGELGRPAYTAVGMPELSPLARQSSPLPGVTASEEVEGVEKRAVLLVALIVVRLALVPVGKAGSVAYNAAVPALGGSEPRLVLVEPEPQAIRRSELCRHEVILLHRADAGRCAPVLLAQ
eukprot:scaffold7499_cov65-Phaeocystis_antarctica.AAC.5